MAGVGFGWEGWFTIAVMAIMFIVLVRDWAPADFTMLLALTTVMSAQIVTTSEGLEGFSSSAVLTVAILYVVAAGINSTGALDYIFDKLLGQPRLLAVAQLRLLLPVGLVSAFLNNTPVVAVMIPIVQRWARKINIPVSQLFIPLSFASILGGTCTLIGTSTNLVIAGKFEEQFTNKTIGLFDLGAVGVPVLFTGFAYIILFSPLLLPGFEVLRRRERKALGLDADDADGDGAGGGTGGGAGGALGFGQDFTVGCSVTHRSPVIGKAVDEAGLRGLEGLYLTSVQRGERLHNAVGPEFVINERDILFFTGLMDKFGEFCLRNGFEIITDANEDRHLPGDSSIDGQFEADGDARNGGARDGRSPGAYDADADGEESDGADGAGGYSSSGYTSDTVLHSKASLAAGAASNVAGADCGEAGSPVPVRGASDWTVGPHGHTGHHVLRSRARGRDRLGSHGGPGLGAGAEGQARTPVLRRRRVQRKERSNTFEERIIKAVVRSGSSLEGKTAKEVKFRKRYDAAILSLFRAGERVSVRGNLGRIELQVGDVLLLITGNDFSWDAPAVAADLKPLLSDDAVLRGAAAASAATVSGVGGGSSVDLLATATQLDLEREFLIPMRVSETPKLKGARSLAGQTVEDAGLRGLPGLFLVAVEHADGEVEHVVPPDFVLVADDLLWFAGERDAVGTLRRIPGLQSPDAQAEKLKVRTVQRRLVECVLGLHSPMVGKTVRETRFRTLYEAAIVAVHRQGRRVLAKIGEVELRAGDVLILDTGPNFVARYRDDPNFLLVTEIDDSAPPRFDKFYIALLAIIGMLVSFLVFSDYITLLEPAVFAAGIMILAGCLTPQRARAAVSWDVIVTIASAFGLSNALENTGVAQVIGDALVDLAEITGTGFVGVLAAVYLATFLLSLVLSNNSAAVLMYEIAVRAALESCPADIGEDACLRQMLFTLMLSASSSFSTPYGYQTNIMVLGVGNYVFNDFLRFGFPMQFWQMAFSLVFVVYDDVWYLSWLFSIGAFTALIFARSFYDKRKSRKADVAAAAAAAAGGGAADAGAGSSKENGTGPLPATAGAAAGSSSPAVKMAADAALSEGVLADDDAIAAADSFVAAEEEKPAAAATGDADAVHVTVV